ncbi:MAG: hypothetical protein K2O97_10980 [Acetatifactor sp.]|nr:hypothetical protein [Acetatifactor sp.]
MKGMAACYDGNRVRAAGALPEFLNRRQRGRSWWSGSPDDPDEQRSGTAQK